MTTTAILTAPTIDDIRAAAARIDGAIEKTPMSHSGVLSKMIGADLWLKFENLQYTAAYKERGALNKLLQLTDDERARGVIAASAGNHAQAVAYHGKRLGIPVTIVMPNPTPTVKVTQTEGHGARVVLHGETFDDAYDHARELEAEEALVFVHPFDDGQIIAGTGTIALEMLAEVPDLDVLVVPIGGGGLISGIAIAAKTINPAIEIIGVEAELYPSMKNVVEGSPRPDRRRHAGRRDCGQGAGQADPRDHRRQGRPHRTGRRARHRACRGACWWRSKRAWSRAPARPGLASILANPERFAGKKVGTILCGGNIDTHLLANVLVRELVRCGRIARLRIAAQDRPGALAAITAKFHECGVNIIEVEHQRIFTRLPAKDTVIEVECEARDAQAIDHAGRAAGSRRFHGRARPARLIKIIPLRDSLAHLTLFGWRQTLFNRVYRSHKEFRNHLEAAGLSAPFRFPKFFVTNPSPCPYLPGKVERKVFTELSGRHSSELNEALGRIGFRRSQSVAYRPSCIDCSACVSVRVRAGEFMPSATQRKLIRRHADLEVSACRPWTTEEQYALLRGYLAQRHPGGGMADMDEHDFADMVEQTPVRTYVVEYREPSVDGRPGKLVGACLSDQQGDGLQHDLQLLRCRPRRPPRAWHLHHPRPHHPRRPRQSALCLSRLLGRRVGPHGLQGDLPADGAARPRRLGPDGRGRSSPRPLDRRPAPDPQPAPDPGRRLGNTVPKRDIKFLVNIY